MRAVRGGRDLGAALAQGRARRCATISARALWIRILTARIETGEPYLIFSDHVNRAQPGASQAGRAGGEDLEPVQRDHAADRAATSTASERTAVCCLSSLNLENWFEWQDHPTFIEDVMRFLDNVLQDFIDRAPAGMERAKYSAMRERSVGLGVMGFHSFLQSQNVPWESVIAKVVEQADVQAHPRAGGRGQSLMLAEERGPCPDAAEYGIMERFSHKMSIAPTASISIIAGNASPGHRADRGERVPAEDAVGQFHGAQPASAEAAGGEGAGQRRRCGRRSLPTKGSVQHLDFLTEQEKAVYKTAFELDQRWIIEHAADRAPFICQSQSVNVFLPANVNKRDLHQIHFMAWKRGVKSLYYCRSLSIQRADNVSEKAVRPAEFVLDRRGAGTGVAAGGSEGKSAGLRRVPGVSVGRLLPLRPSGRREPG